MTLSLSAQYFAFDRSTLTVPAGASVTINFSQGDDGVYHNFAVYETLPGGQTRPVFVGATILGPSSAVYSFTAPAAGGDYFFECDVHPLQMTGKLVVTP
ncbi:MAG: cupredoxin domain-containing protein [Chloroflexi bacterium]|nr:cupredoxin domain-containing protein [Chloroflexota bacterium]